MARPKKVKQEVKDIEVVAEVVTPVAPVAVEEKSVLDEILENVEKPNKVLIVSKDTVSSEEDFLIFTMELQKQRQGVKTIVVEQKNRAVHINGVVYVKFCCAKMASHFASQRAWNSVITL